MIGVAFCLLLSSVWTAFTPVSASAAELSQTAANSEGPPEVERFGYLFEELRRCCLMETNLMQDDANSDLAALEKIAPQPRATTAVAPYVPGPSGLSVTRGSGLRKRLQ